LVVAKELRRAKVKPVVPSSSIVHRMGKKPRSNKQIEGQNKFAPVNASAIKAVSEARERRVVERAFKLDIQIKANVAPKTN